MPSTPSSSLRLELMGTGEDSGTWGLVNNNNLGTLLEQAITGVASITMADADHTLTNYDYVVNEARNAVLVVKGTNTAIRDIIAPLVPKLYIVKNNTTGGFGINIRSNTGTGITIPANNTQWVYCDGHNFYSTSTGNAAASTAALDVYLGTTQPVVSGSSTKIRLDTKEFDVTGAYDEVNNYRFQPTVAGYYQINGRFRGTGSAGVTSQWMEIWKSGVTGFRLCESSNGITIAGSQVVSLNGTSDYLEFNGVVIGSGSVAFDASFGGAGVTGPRVSAFFVREL